MLCILSINKSLADINFVFKDLLFKATDNAGPQHVDISLKYNIYHTERYSYTS
jgi:hypothetical protein